MTNDPFLRMDEGDAPEEDFEDFFGEVDSSDLDGGGDAGSKEVDWYNSNQPRDNYTPPSDGSWVPLKILSAQPRNSREEDDNAPSWARWRNKKKVCVAFGPEGRRSAVYGGVQKILEMGGREEIREVDLDYIETSLDHVAPRYGSKPWPYTLTVPVWDLKIPFKMPRGKKTGFKDDSGWRLRTAAGVSLKGKKITPQMLPDICDEMVGKIILAQVNVSRKRGKPVMREDGNGDPIMVQIDRESGEPVKITKEGEEFSVKDGKLYTGDISGLVKVDDQTWAIRDTTGNGVPLMDPGPWQDREYLYDKVAPLPERNIKVNRRDGTEAEGEITWDTVGNIATSEFVPGATKVEVLTSSAELIPAVWMGSLWQELPKEDDVPF